AGPPAVADDRPQVGGVLLVELAGLGLVEHVLGEDAGLDALGQLDLLRRCEQRGLADPVQVDANQVGRRALGVEVLGRDLRGDPVGTIARTGTERLGVGTLTRDGGPGSLRPVDRGRCHVVLPLRDPGGALASAAAGALMGLNAPCAHIVPTFRVCARALSARPQQSGTYTSTSTVNGPSFTDSTAIIAPNT